MNLKYTALLLVGFQNDFFAKNGLLRDVVENKDTVDRTLNNTLSLIDRLVSTEASIISTPIVLKPDYRALASPFGILNTIKESGAFAEGTTGAQDIAELQAFGSRIQYVKGKIGFNAFSDTLLHAVLKEKNISHVLLAGMVTSLCIDSTGRAAYEHGYNVSVLSDCTSARTKIEQSYYCEHVFPLYGNVLNSAEIPT